MGLVLSHFLPFFRKICFDIFALSGNNRENWTEDLWKYPNYKLEKLCIRPQRKLDYSNLTQTVKYLSLKIACNESALNYLYLGLLDIGVTGQTTV